MKNQYNRCNHKTFTIRKTSQILDFSLALQLFISAFFAFRNIFHIFFLLFFQHTFIPFNLAILILLSKTIWPNYRPADRMWPTTAFSVARGSIQEKSSNLKFVEKRVMLRLGKVHLHKSNAISVYHFVLFIYFAIKSEGLRFSANPPLCMRVHFMR